MSDSKTASVLVKGIKHSGFLVLRLINMACIVMALDGIMGADSDVGSRGCFVS